MSATSKRQLIVNIFGTFGYISLIMQWLWVSVLFLPQLFENESVKDFFMPSPEVPQAPQFEFHTPPILATIIAVVVTISVLIITVIVLIRLPSSISKVGKKTTRKAAEKVIPVLTHHQKLPASKKRQLTVRMIRVLKLIFTLLPFLLLGLVAFIPTNLPDEIVLFVGAFLALGTLIWFTLEYVVARLLNVEPMKLV